MSKFASSSSCFFPLLLPLMRLVYLTIDRSKHTRIRCIAWLKIVSRSSLLVFPSFSRSTWRSKRADRQMKFDSKSVRNWSCAWTRACVCVCEGEKHKKNAKPGRRKVNADLRIQRTNSHSSIFKASFPLR